MNDDLLKRLREPCFERGLDEMWIDDQRNEAADRIAELEAQVAKARNDELRESASRANRIAYFFDKDTNPE